ncbi:MAG: prolyl oligopeptidase family serine peptidase [Phycisphaerales bacterium]
MKPMIPIVLAFFLVPMLAVRAAERSGSAVTDPGFHFVEVKGEHGVVKGTIYVPRGLDTSKGAPCLVFLNGYGECGTDGLKNLGVGLPNAIVWDAARWPFVVVMPQKPVYDMEWDAYEDAVLAMLDLAVAEYGADPDRVGVTGLSQGGHGTIAIATHHPERFKAAAPVCGYTFSHFNDKGERVSRDEAAAERRLTEASSAMKGMAVWIFHGGRDDVVSPDESRNLHEALVHAGAEDVKLTIFPEDNHNSWDSAYRKSGLWDWFTQRLSKDKTDD